jgi:cytidyltransferase-like protein
MNKILSMENAINIAKELHKQKKTIVIVGGFFDILHLGHIKFLEKSKKYADYLFVFLEEDAKAAIEKGGKRPINSQTIRAKILSSLEIVNYIVMLKNMTSSDRYDKILIEMQPNVIATVYGDPKVNYKKKQAKLIKAKLAYVIKKINNYSTTKYAKSIM